MRQWKTHSLFAQILILPWNTWPYLNKWPLICHSHEAWSGSSFIFCFVLFCHRNGRCYCKFKCNQLYTNNGPSSSTKAHIFKECSLTWKNAYGKKSCCSPYTPYVFHICQHPPRGHVTIPCHLQYTEINSLRDWGTEKPLCGVNFFFCDDSCCGHMFQMAQLMMELPPACILETLLGRSICDCPLWGI